VPDPPSRRAAASKPASRAGTAESYERIAASPPDVSTGPLRHHLPFTRHPHSRDRREATTSPATCPGHRPGQRAHRGDLPDRAPAWRTGRADGEGCAAVATGQRPQRLTIRAGSPPATIAVPGAAAASQRPGGVAGEQDVDVTHRRSRTSGWLAAVGQDGASLAHPTASRGARVRVRGEGTAPDSTRRRRGIGGRRGRKPISRISLPTATNGRGAGSQKTPNGARRKRTLDLGGPSERTRVADPRRTRSSTPGPGAAWCARGARPRGTSTGPDQRLIVHGRCYRRLLYHNASHWLNPYRSCVHPGARCASQLYQGKSFPPGRSEAPGRSARSPNYMVARKARWRCPPWLLR
jgi:hypothetical protein